MKSRDEMKSGHVPTRSDQTQPAGGPVDHSHRTQETPMLTGASVPSRPETEVPGGQPEYDTSPVPRITSAPPGIEVIEARAGTAEGQWVLHVRCQCGRRWFEVDAVRASTCPRCGLLVYVNIQGFSPRK